VSEDTHPFPPFREDSKEGGVLAKARFSLFPKERSLLVDKRRSKMFKKMRKISVIITILLLIPLSIAGAKMREMDADTEYKFACFAYRKGNVEEAMNGFIQFLKDFPNDFRSGSAQFMIGQCLFDKGRYKEARKAFSKARKRSGGDYGLFINCTYRLGECEFNSGEYLDAIDYFQKVRKGKNKNLRGEALYGIALSYLAIEEIEKAKDCLLELLLFYPGYNSQPNALIPLGLILLEKGEAKTALGYFRRVKDDLGCIYYSGVAFRELNKVMMATALFKDVLRKGAESQWVDKAQYQIGESFFQSKQYPLASEALENLLSVYPESDLREEASYLLACSDFQQGKYAEAEIKLQKLLKEFPDNPLALYSNYLIGEISLKQNDFAKALANYSLALNVEKLSMYSLFKIIWCHAQQNQYEEAITKAKEFLQSYQWGELAANVLLIEGLAYQKTGRHPQALRCYQEIVDKYAGTLFFEKALYLMATAYYELERYSQLVTNVHQILKNAPSSSTVWRAETYYMIGEGYYALGKYSEAARIYELVSKNFPTSRLLTRAYQAISSCYAQRGEYDRAGEVQEKALVMAQEEGGEVSDLTLLEMGNIQFNKKEYEKAISYYEEFVKRSPGNPRVSQALYQEGIALYRLEYFSEAIKKWEKVAREHEQDELAPRALLQAGKTYFGLGKYSQALSIYQRLREKYPGSEMVKDAVLQVGQCYYNQGKIQDAITQYEKFIKDYPDDERVGAVLEQLQMSYYRQGKSIEELEKLIAQFPKSRFAADTYWKLGAEAFNRKNYPLAQRYFQKVVLDFPESTSAAQAFYYQAECYYLQEKYFEAVSSYENFVLNFPEDRLVSQAMFREAICYFSMGEFEKSVNAFKEFSLSYPEDPLVKDAALNIALCYKKVQKLRESIEAYENFVTVYPKDEKVGFAFLQIGSLYEVMDEYKKAVEAYEKVPGRKREKGEAEFYAARCYDKLKMPEKEKQVYEALVNFVPKSDEYRLAGLMRLAEIYEAEGQLKKGLVIYGDIVNNSKNPDWVALAKERMKILKQKK
jgi:TolA-binding protein